MLGLLLITLPQQYRSVVEKLYYEYKDVTMYIALGIVKDKDMAQDIVHHAFMNVIKHIEKIEALSTKEQKGYILCIVKNLSFDYLRKRKRENTVPYENVESFIPDDAESTESIVMAGLEVGLVKKKLKEMDEKYALPLILKYTLGMSHIEIADMLDISVSNAKARCHRGRKKLIEAVGKETHYE